MTLDPRLGATKGDEGTDDPYAVVRRDDPLLVVISGPSGVGKDATMAKMREIRLPFHFVVTATTRPRRPNEVDGMDYLFLSEEQFQDLLDRDELLEHAVVYGRQYGILKRHVREALGTGVDAILRIDVQGAATIRQRVPAAVQIFLSAASGEELEERLRTRDTETEESLNIRIETARCEMERITEFDYVVVNGHSRLDKTVQKISAIIEAEKCRLARARVEV